MSGDLDMDGWVDGWMDRQTDSWFDENSLKMFRLKWFCGIPASRCFRMLSNCPYGHALHFPALKTIQQHVHQTNHMLPSTLCRALIYL